MIFIVLVSLLNACNAATAQHNYNYHDVHDHDRQIERRAPPPIRPPPAEPDPGQDPGNNEPPTTGSHLLCTPYGKCEQCPPEAMHQPFCQPFGNRRLVHCVNATAVAHAAGSPRWAQKEGDSNPPPEHNKQVDSTRPPPPPEGEQLAWEACGRIPAQERADFLEFVACNVIFVIVALAIVFWRSKVVQARQARVLAARIGLIGRGLRR
ncbi:hypothetical protein FA15DRAFT_673282 [Coprinopsis marcescibilis]|uniref:Uncharacterized protein n=1 Tax=Coprinopsis marcescibilis TaxID=230819 RepID=A0A5C3KKG6_COPMA|nr:hypothetical protein FA15DRAFT_673282 [Coprinopsis marcescibilis]